MATLSLNELLQDAFVTEFSDTIFHYVSESALYCEILLKVIDSDIHSVNLTKFLDTDVTNFREAIDIQQFLLTASNSKITNLSSIEKAWQQYYLPRIYVFLNTTTFSGKRLDRDTIYLLFGNLNTSGQIEANTLKKLIAEGEKHLSFFSNKCKDEDWYYDINGVLDVIEQYKLLTKQNTIPLFLTIMKAIEPKFIDNLRANFGKRLGLSIKLHSLRNKVMVAG